MKQFARNISYSIFGSALVLLTACAPPTQAADTARLEPSKLRSPYEVIDQAQAQSWRSIDAENTLYLELDSGRVVIELAPQFAPNHVANMKALVREGFYDGLSVYRFVEGFVAQGGDESEKKPVKNAKKTIASERFIKADLPFNSVDKNDPFIGESGFVNGFAAAKNANNEHWMVHCPGAFAMARNNPLDSGGTEFYIVLGHAPRYLDRNVTVFGRVIAGMEHVQSLQRKPTEGKAFNTIKTIQVAADLVKAQQEDWQIMKTSSADFKEIVASRAQRPEEWFVEAPAYVDVCGVPVPSRKAPNASGAPKTSK